MSYSNYVFPKLKKHLKDFYYRENLSCENPMVMDLYELLTFASDNGIDIESFLLPLKEKYEKLENKINKFGLPFEVNNLLELLESISDKSYLVGGCVRDMLLEKTPKDWDFVTDIPYDELISILKENGYSVKEMGKQFLVLQASINGWDFEIANFRKDGTYIDGRRPDSVQIGTIDDDAQRRDFTINAIYWNNRGLTTPNEFSIDDIIDKKLRFIGKPHDRIKEDYLRGYRFYRFISTKGVKPEKNSLKAVREMWSEIQVNTNAQRAINEIEKIVLKGIK